MFCKFEISIGEVFMSKHRPYFLGAFYDPEDDKTYEDFACEKCGDTVTIKEDEDLDDWEGCKVEDE